MKYSLWAKWLTLSVISSIIIAFIGLLPGSVEVVPNWPIYASLCLINLLLCVVVGLFLKED
jgi:hypothetical protein